MSLRSENRINKHKVQVQVHLNDGNQLFGHIFLAAQQRALDVLNDGRRFVPFLGSDGMTHLLRVDGIARVVEMQQEPVAAASDPYEVLGVTYRATDDELTQTYHELCRQFHPDRMTQFGLPKELVATASAMTARIIDAYSRIKKARAAPVRV